MSGRRDNPYKLYIDVDLTNTAGGGKILRAFRLAEGYKTFEIDHHAKPRPLASQKAGGCGMMYLCRVRGVRLHIFQEIFEDEYTDYWFVAGEEASRLFNGDQGD